jgi:HSP20 family molecular chaperone IbpA
MYYSLWDELLYDRKPTIMIQKEEDGFTRFVELELPGFKKEEVKVNVEKQYVSVIAQNKNRKHQETVWMPKTIDTSTVKAKLENGILRLSFAERVASKKEVLVE